MSKVSILSVLVMVSTLGAEVLTAVVLLFLVAIEEPPVLRAIALLNANPTILTINSLWLVILTLWGIIKITSTVGKSTNALLNQVFGKWTRSSPESS